MFCQLCATKIEEGEFFCRNCGEGSQSLVYIEDKPKRLQQTLFFVSGFGAFLILFFILFFIVDKITPPGFRTPLVLFILVLFLAGLVSGLSAVLISELKDSRRKLNEEREKRRTVLSNAPTKLIEERNIPTTPFSVTEPTTQKLQKH